MDIISLSYIGFCISIKFISINLEMTSTLSNFWDWRKLNKFYSMKSESVSLSLCLSSITLFQPHFERSNLCCSLLPFFSWISQYQYTGGNNCKNYKLLFFSSYMCFFIAYYWKQFVTALKEPVLKHLFPISNIETIIFSVDYMHSRLEGFTELIFSMKLH